MTYSIPRPAELIVAPIMVEDGECCCYCGQPLDDESFPTRKNVDHIFPRRLGGLNHNGNFAISCQSCNDSKNGNHPFDYWLENHETWPEGVSDDFLMRVIRWSTWFVKVDFCDR